jgi:aryl carrier-like protein
MREYMDGLYELFIARDPKLELLQGVFYTFPEIDEWSMNDLYERHPEKPFLYRYKGRKDDVIVLSNGEKISPALMEATLTSDPRVNGAMVLGRGKFQPAALIDLVDKPPQGTLQRRQLVEALLPVIGEANKHAPAHGKLDQYHILFANPEKPIHYLGQGKIQRYLTYKEYEKDIDELYLAADDADEGMSSLPDLDFSTERGIHRWLRQLIVEIAEMRDLESDQDIFEAGIDSLQVLRMTRELKIQGRRVDTTFAPMAFYQHPTLNQLTQFIYRHVRGKEDEPLTEQKMRSLLESYAETLPRTVRARRPPSPENMVVVLSGSTGSLGSYLLEALYHNEKVSRVICLNRSPNARERHQHASHGVTGELGDRVEFFQADLSQPLLGLQVDVYKRMLRTVTHVIRK